MESLSSQSDLDPSDPQPGPSCQTRLRVFKPSAVPEPADLLPGACNWEQAALEDPADPQLGPSVLEASAPQDPADLQPGSLKEQADHQPGPSNSINEDPFEAVSELVPQNRDYSRQASEYTANVF